MNKFLTLIAFLAAAVVPAFSCTSLIVAKGAGEDNSVFITYAADSHVLYGELYNQPASDNPEGTMRKVVDWDTGKPLGEIPEVAHTYSTIGNMNEWGLAIAESTWGGRPELEGSGMIDYGSLIYITLQRARTAREALKVMTQLVEDYGYASSGESFSIADANEVWIMELIGKGKDDPGAVWVARRVPDGYISGHANHARIHTFPLNDPETIYSKDVISFARKKGYFSGKDEEFDFSKAYAITDFSALRGCDARVWAFFNKHSSNMEQYLPWIDRAEGEPMPLWVKPTKPLTAGDMKSMMRNHFENTPYDMTHDIGAGPYAVPYRWRPMTFKVDGVEYTNERAIATQQTGFSFVAQLRGHLPRYMRGLLWFGTDDANTCIYLPIFCAVNHAPKELAQGNGDMCTISWTSNFWVNNYVANQAYNRYSQMIPDIRAKQKELEDAIAIDVRNCLEQLPTFEDEDAIDLVQDLADIWAEKATREWKEFGDYLLVKFMDGNIKNQEADGSFKRNEHGMPASPQYGGYDERYYRSISQDPAAENLRVKEIKY